MLTNPRHQQFLWPNKHVFPVHILTHGFAILPTHNSGPDRQHPTVVFRSYVSRGPRPIIGDVCSSLTDQIHFRFHIRCRRSEHAPKISSQLPPHEGTYDERARCTLSY